MLKIIGVKITEIGKFNSKCNLILLNHNSMLDVIVMEYIHPIEISWIAKKSLSKIPIFGYLFKLVGLIFVDKNNKFSKKLLKKCKLSLENSKILGIFPEGTRGDNSSISKFYKGSKIIAEKFDLTIQPIVLVNTRERLDTKKFIVTPGKIKIIYLDTIETKDTDWFINLENEMKEKYLEYSKKI
ncbi:lysophospholipid acyltransferase family protein [Arcobacter sp.]